MFTFEMSLQLQFFQWNLEVAGSNPNKAKFLSSQISHAPYSLCSHINSTPVKSYNFVLDRALKL